MDISNLTPDPHATSYYDRLDIAQDADDEIVNKAGKVALAEFSETETQLLLNVKQARNILTDSKTRRIYDGFIEEFGIETGTRAFEDWEQASAVSVEEFKSRIEATESSSAEDIAWEDIEISSPSVIRNQSQTDKYVEINLWEGDRLYINEFYDEDIFIDVDTGRIYTQDYQEVGNIGRELSESENQLKLTYDGQKLHIDLTGGGSWDENMVPVQDVRIEWVNKSQLENGSVSHWSREGVDPRIYLNNIFDIGDVYVNIKNGLVYAEEDNSIIQSATCNLNSKGDEIHLSYKDATLKISLITPTESIPTPPSPDEEFDGENTQDDGEVNENKQRERHDWEDPQENSDEFEDAYDGKEFGYDPNEGDGESTRDDGYKNKDADEDETNVEPSDIFSMYNGDSIVIRALLYPIFGFFYIGMYTSLKMRWRWQFGFGMAVLFAAYGMQTFLGLGAAISNIVYVFVTPGFYAFTIPVFPLTAWYMGDETMIFRIGIGLYPFVYWFIVTMFIENIS